MTTEKLIELAEICGYGSCTPNCPYYTDDLSECGFKLLNDVTDRLEKAYIELKDLSCCSNCGNRKCFAPKYTEYCINGEWKWEGDKE
nr:MAG TPA: hypothetical protein [Caudoviricetes sp.]